MGEDTAGLKAKEDFCLGRYVGSEKGKKTYPSFIVN